LGRVASHVSIDIREAAVSEEVATENNNTTSSSSNAMGKAFRDAVPQSSPKPIDKVMFDDSITPVENVTEIPPEASRVDYYDGIAHVQSKKKKNVDENTKSNQTPGIYLNVRVPEKVNLVCDIQNGGSISVLDKIEGDVRLRVDGDICVKKLRGNTIELKNHHGAVAGNIYVSSLLEAQKVALETNGRVRAKQIHGSTIDIVVHHTGASAAAAAADDDDDNVNKNDGGSLPARTKPPIMDEDDEGSLVDVSSMFVSGNGVASVQVRGGEPLPRRAVRIKSHHGFLAVSTDGVPQPNGCNEMTGQIYPLVELGGVNGSCEVSVDNVVTKPECAGSWPSSMVHIDSLSPESVSFVTAKQGDISITLDRKAEADLRLLSVQSSEEALSVPWTEMGPLLVDDDEHDKLVSNLRQALQEKTSFSDAPVEDDKISIQTKAVTVRSSLSSTGGNISYLDGWAENKSAEPDSRFERQTRGFDGSVGKIRMDGAADQALEAFSSDAKQGDGGVGGDEGPIRPLLAVAGRQNIKLETVSWLGAIARRYGLEEENRKRDLGRTASRRGRPITPASDE